MLWQLLFLTVSIAQKIIVVGSTGKFYSIDLSSCSIDSLNTPSCSKTQLNGNPYSIALYHDTLYYNVINGGLYRTVLNDTFVCQKLDSMVYANSLAVDKNGILYFIDSFRLETFNPYNDLKDTLGFINYFSQGDLFFYDDTLILASSSGLININISDPPKSTVYVQTGGRTFYGLAPTCNKDIIVGFQPTVTLDSTNLVEINLATKSIIGTRCTIPIGVDDAADFTDAYGNESSISIDSIYRPSCIANSTSTSLQLSATEGNGDPITYLLNTSISNATGLFTGLVAGSDSIKLSDTYGCSVDTVIRINLSADISAAFQIEGDTCGAKIGAVLFSPSTDAEYLFFSLNNGPYQQVISFSGLDTGLYDLKIRDTNYCFVDTNFMIADFAPPAPEINFTNSQICNSTDEGLIHINIPGAGTPFTLNFAGNNYTLSDSISFTDLSSGTYKFSLESQNGCSWTYSDSLAIIILTGNIFPYRDSTVCQSDSIILDALNAGANYFWDNGSTNESRIIDSSGTYWVSASANGCTVSDTLSLQFLKIPEIHFPPDTTLCTTENLLLDATFPQTTYEWQDGTTLPTYTVTKAGIYYVSATDFCGTITDSINVQFKNCLCALYIPSAFTPNNDGINDIFIPVHACPTEDYSMKIYNRWGQLIFTSNNVSVGWNGTFDNIPQPSGTYVWELTYKDNSTGQIIYKNGIVVLIR